MRLSLPRGYLFPFLVLFVIALLLFEFYVFLIISRDRRNVVDKIFIQDYETVLCSLSVPRKPYQPSKAPCPTQGIVTTFREGTLSRQMWQYANVLTASINTGLDGYIPVCLQRSLAKVFDNLSIPLLAEIGHCEVPLPESVSSIEDWSSADQSIVIRGSERANDFVAQQLPVLRSHFRFNKGMRNAAAAHLLRAKGKATNVTFIGVCITKTSIVANQEYDNAYPSVDFFVDAMNYFRKQYSNAVFVVIADEKPFWESVLDKRDVYIVEESELEPSEVGLSVLAHCNHSILASEDFAVWGAILSGGEVILSLCVSEDFNSLIQANKNWEYLHNDTKPSDKFLGGNF